MTVQAKKSLGQHWLTDERTLDSICEAAEISPKDTILEVGPGTGTLTRKLVKLAREVVAVELDERLAAVLPKRVPADNMKIVRCSILEFDLTSLPKDYKIVANIPYYLTSNLIKVMSESSNPPALAVILIQKEVAERATAKPGDMSILSVATQFYWKGELGLIVPPELFDPAPKVDSQVLVLKRRRVPLFESADPKKFFLVVRAGFSNRRKTLLNSLSGGLRESKETITEVLEVANIDPRVRAQELSLDQWNSLYLSYYERQNLKN